MNLIQTQELLNQQKHARESMAAIRTQWPWLQPGDIQKEALDIICWAVGQSYMGNSVAWVNPENKLKHRRSLGVILFPLDNARINGEVGRESEGFVDKLSSKTAPAIPSAEAALSQSQLSDVEALRQYGILLLHGTLAQAEEGYKLMAVDQAGAKIPYVSPSAQFRESLLPDAEMMQKLFGGSEPDSGKAR